MEPAFAKPDKDGKASEGTSASAGEGRPEVPGRDCTLCPRLADFRRANRESFPGFHNAPVASFGPLDARLLVVGLAPGLKGANRTARPFTGDYAGDLLYPTLIEYGFAAGRYGADPGDELEMRDCRITNAVRCVPPENKPVGAEINACRPFLQAEIAAMPNLAIVLALGSIAHTSLLRTFGLRQNGFKFTHGALHPLPDGRPVLADSYHCSRYNTNTGRLTPAMFHAVFRKIREKLEFGDSR